MLGGVRGALFSIMGRAVYSIGISTFLIDEGFFNYFFAFFDFPFGQIVEYLDYSCFIDGTDLVDRYHSFFSIVFDRNPCWIPF